MIVNALRIESIQACESSKTIELTLMDLLLSLNKLSSDQFLYHLLNIAGAVGLIVHALNLNDYPNLAVNICWGIIAIIAIVHIRNKRVRN